MTKISTGSSDLDKWIGGYDSDIITTIYGPGGSGKTNSCMIAAAHAAKTGKVIYMDTEGGFSVERFMQIVGDKEYLKNVLLLKPTSFYEQSQDFKKLLAEIKMTNVKLIVIDGMTMLYRLELAEANSSGKIEKVQKINGFLAYQLRNLNEIARKKEIPVIITNQVYSNFKEEGTVNMVGGDILKYWSKCIMELQKHGVRRKLILRKHRSRGEGEFNFEICDSGIKKKGIF